MHIIYIYFDFVGMLSIKNHEHYIEKRFFEDQQSFSLGQRRSRKKKEEKQISDMGSI